MAKFKLRKQTLCVKKQKSCPWADADAHGSLHMKKSPVLGGATTDSLAMPRLAIIQAGL